MKVVEAGRVQLPLEPLCYERDLPIPSVEGRGAAPAAGVTVGSFGRAAIERPTQKNTVLLPPTMGGTTTTLIMDFPRTGAPGVVDAKFEAVWSSRAPPQKLDLRPTVVTFDWKGPCEYPYKTECPSVRLGETGEEQESEGGAPVAGVCRYRFAPSGGTIALPAEVTFHSTRLPAWNAKVSRPGAHLSDYVDPASRMFLVKVPWASQSKKLADEIDSVELVGPTGTRQSVKPADALVALPFGSCGGTVGYHLFGRRDYKPGNATIVEGVIEIDSPGETAYLAALGLSVGGGFEVSLTRPETRPYAQAELSLRLKPKRWGSAESQWEASWITRPDFELGVTYVFTPQPYTPLRTPDNAADEKLETVPYNRFLLGGLVLWPLFVDSVTIGPGIGGGLGYSVRGSDSHRTGGVQFFGVGGGRIRYDMSRRFSLVGTGRFIFPDQLQQFTSTNDFRGSADRTSETQSWFFFDFALQGWL